MQLKDKIQFVQSTVEPMAQYTFPYICSIIGVIDSEQGAHVGSALRCSLGGKQVAITAAHVMHQAQQDYSGVAISAGYGIEPYQIHGQIRLDTVADLAVYSLPADYPDKGGQVALWPEDRIEDDTERLSIDYLFVHGFPGQRSRFLALCKGLANRSLPYGAMQRVEETPADLQLFQFAIEFDPVDMRVEGRATVPSVDPHGLSGSPVWRIGASGRSASEWTPQSSLLVGIVTQWRPEAKVLVATHAGKVLDLVKA